MAIQEIFNAVTEFKKDKVTELVMTEIDSGTEISIILNDGLIAPLDEIGKQFSDGKLFVPEMLRAAQTMKAGLEVLRPFLEDADREAKGTLVIGTVKGDLHDIGKNLVSMMIEGAGFKVIDLGIDVVSDKFIAAAEDNLADIVAISALLTTSIPAMEATVAAIKETGLQVKIMVGGAPLNLELADRIGADGYSDNAPGAVSIAREFMALGLNPD
jgi:5-methyltetrahydrofolate--homocysteine methyltransferase